MIIEIPIKIYEKYIKPNNPMLEKEDIIVVYRCGDKVCIKSVIPIRLYFGKKTVARFVRDQLRVKGGRVVVEERTKRAIIINPDMKRVTLYLPKELYALAKRVVSENKEFKSVSKVLLVSLASFLRDYGVIDEYLRDDEYKTYIQ